MKRIRSFQYRNMRNADASQTYNRLVDVYKLIEDEKLLPVIQAFFLATDEFTECMRVDIASVFTRKMRPYELQRDRLLTDIFRGVANGMRDVDANVVEHANVIDIVLRLYGNPSREAHDTQTRVIDKIIRDLRLPNNAEALSRMPAVEIAVDQLENINNQFAIYFNERLFQHKGREVGITQHRRDTADEAARNVVDYINGFVLFFEDEKVLDVIVSANIILNEAQALINRRRGQRNANANENPDGDIDIDDDIDNGIDDDDTEEEKPDKEE